MQPKTSPRIAVRTSMRKIIRHSGYWASQAIRKRIEEANG
jgi:hypothetical protein